MTRRQSDTDPVAGILFGLILVLPFWLAAAVLVWRHL